MQETTRHGTNPSGRTPERLGFGDGISVQRGRKPGLEATMTCNVGKIDRTGRIVGGIVLLAVGALMPSIGMGWRVAALVVAAIALVTAVVRYCPANAVFGINTCTDK
jgi:hypothetical protein